ncbi:MAG: hypothetical protein GF330_10395, partial [Candidatus Eisenbacteria bacterium]|nr:hypothetical protein [Candidatus Eisenbacteria bacterium]
WRLLRDAAAALTALPRPGRSALRQGREAGLLVLATLPVVVVALLLNDAIEAAFERPRTAALFLMGTGVLLLGTRLLPRRGRPIGARVALAMGIAQVVSLLPGVSRSGATISGGLFARGDAEAVVRFSFLMSVPAILGSVLVHLSDLARLSSEGLLLPYAVGFLVALVSGLLAIQVLLRVVARGRFYLFGIYCVLVGAFAWWVLGRI